MMVEKPIKQLTTALLVLMLCACAKPDVSVTEATGNGSADAGQRWRVVNYWATWCGPCILEIEELNHLAQDYSDELVVLGVNFDNPITEAERQAAIREMNILFPVYPQDPAVDLGIKTPLVLPTTFMFAPDGALVETLVGPQTGESILAVIHGHDSGQQSRLSR
jgi:thiol-disulfide isomerase/thioredoxin